MEKDKKTMERINGCYVSFLCSELECDYKTGKDCEYKIKHYCQSAEARKKALEWEVKNEKNQ